MSNKVDSPKRPEALWGRELYASYYPIESTDAYMDYLEERVRQYRGMHAQDCNVWKNWRGGIEDDRCGLCKEVDERFPAPPTEPIAVDPLKTGIGGV